MKAPINIAGRHGTEGQRPTRAAMQSTHDNIYAGTVIYVHPETQTMDIELHDSKHALLDVQILMPGMGPGSMMGVMPERNSVVLLIQDISNGSTKKYYPIAYFPPDPTGGRKYRVVEKYTKDETDISTDMYRLMISRMRHMGEGDAILSSRGGAEVYLDNDVELHDGMGHELRIRQGDGSLLATSRNNYMFTNGVWRGAGLIQRNSLVTAGATDLEAQRVTLSDGRVATYVGGQYIKKDADGNLKPDEMYTEYRLDVEDSVFSHIPVNDINSEANLTDRGSPKSTFVLGNMVGNDPGNDGTYGRFLAPRFIEGNNLANATFALAPLTRTGDENQYKTKGVAWGLGFSTVSFMGADKEGSMHRYMGAGRGAVNRGWSLTSVAEGGRREVWGADGNQGLSWSALYRGGLQWNVGKSTGNVVKGQLPWGLNIKSEGNTFISHGDSTVSDTALKSITDSTQDLALADIVRYARIEKVFGSARDEIEGDYELKIGGDYVWSVGGKFRYRVQGNFGESVFGDRSINSTGTIALNSTAVTVASGSRTEKFTTGDDDKLIMLGNDVTTIGTGFQKTVIGVGGKETTIAAGNHKTTLTAGSFSMSVLVGDASVTTKAGNVELTTAVGTAKVGGVSVSITGLTSVSVEAPSVSLGLAPTNSGVITMLSHKDYMTGLPLIPSMTVTAAL